MAYFSHAFFEFTRQKGTKPKTDFWRENSNIFMTYLSYYHLLKALIINLPLLSVWRKLS